MHDSRIDPEALALLRLPLLPAEVAPVILLGEETRLAIVAALNQVDVGVISNIRRTNKNWDKSHILTKEILETQYLITDRFWSWLFELEIAS